MADLLGEDLGLAEIHKLYRCHATATRCPAQPGRNRHSLPGASSR
jgi:hypothetical protein